MKTEWSNKDSLEIPETTAGYGSLSWSDYKTGTSCDSVGLPITKAIKQNDVIDVIYDSIYGYSLEEAFKILEDHRKGAYILVEWIREYCKYNHTPDGMDWHKAVDLIIKRWEIENERRKGEEEK